VLHAVGASANHHGGMVTAKLGKLVLQLLHVKSAKTSGVRYV